MCEPGLDELVARIASGEERAFVIAYDRLLGQTADPKAQATLLWLKRNMPRTADKVLAEIRARFASPALPG